MKTKSMEEKLAAAKAWLAANPLRNPPIIGRYAHIVTRMPAMHPGGPLKAHEVKGSIK